VDRGIRSLIHLQNTASTARVLNLLAIAQRSSDDPDYVDHPFFDSTLLNRAFIIKHRLRRNEQDLFDSCRQSATKVLLPLENTDLRMGGRYVFVGQRGYEDILADLIGEDADSRDRHLLNLIDGLPSLDPFLLREQLKRHGIEPARCYFDLTDADVQRMLSFVRNEVNPLVRQAFNGDATFALTAKLVNKILSASMDSETEPLRLTLRLRPDEYQEGVFCWKGFLYYKWSLSEMLAGLRPLMAQIERIRPEGPVNEDARLYLEQGRARLRRSMSEALTIVRDTLQVYDDAYANLTSNGRPLAFREFLLEAPSLFSQLGERLGGLRHIESFWGYRFPAHQRARIGVEELLDMFMDFEGGLSLSGPTAARALQWA
jgi:hypothetical protein